MWTKWWRKHVGPRLADQRRAGVEVVVVEHHQGLGVALDRPEHGRRDVGVDDPVALVPGIGLLLADVGSVGEVPEVVLDEPQDRVGDHVVEAVVGRSGRSRPAGPRSRPRRARPRTGLAARLAADGDVLVGHRRGDPERPAMGDQPAQRRDQAPAAAPSPCARRPRRARTPPGRGWRRSPAAAQRLTARPPRTARSQSRSRRGVRNSSRARSLPARPEPLGELRVAEHAQGALGGLARAR